MFLHRRQGRLRPARRSRTDAGVVPPTFSRDRTLLVVRIDEDGEVAGYPIKAIRKALRWPARRHHGQVETRRLATELGVDDAEAARSAERLVEAGHLTSSGWDDIWELTNDALRLACSRLGPPIPRRRAWTALQEMLDRAEEVNASEDYLYWVEQVVLFGSLTDATQTTMGDVDVAAELNNVRR